MKLLILCNCNRKFKKQNTDIKKEIISAAERLGSKIINYADSGISFVNIYNDPSVKYDKHGDCYTYKHHGRNKTQIRLLYACYQTEESTTIIIIDFFEKRRSSQSNQKEHIVLFDSYNKINITNFVNNKNLVSVY